MKKRTMFSKWMTRTKTPETLLTMPIAGRIAIIRALTFDSFLVDVQACMKADPRVRNSVRGAATLLADNPSVDLEFVLRVLSDCHCAQGAEKSQRLEDHLHWHTKNTGFKSIAG